MMEGEPEAYTDESLRSIGISPRERLARIEVLLVNIEGKLDHKADRTDVIALESRIWALEMTGGRAAIEAIAEAKRIEAELHILRDDHGTLKSRIAWVGGALAVAAVVGEYALVHILG